MAGASGITQGLAGSAFSRIDVADGSAVATHIPVLDGGAPLYQIDFETLQRALRTSGSVEEIESAMSNG